MQLAGGLPSCFSPEVTTAAVMILSSVIMSFISKEGSVCNLICPTLASVSCDIGLTYLATMGIMLGYLVFIVVLA